MALRAGYYGVKRRIWEALQKAVSEDTQEIADIRSEQALLGARNLNATDYTKASALTNIVPTFNSDGSITVNGTTTSAESLAGGSAANFTAWYGGSVRIGEAPANVTIALYDATAGSNAGTAGQTVTMIAGHAYRLSITFAANKTFTNVKVNPLIVIASDPTTEPSAYAMTNQELTKLATTLKYEVLYVDEPTTINTNKDISLDPLLGGKTYFVVAALFQHVTNDGYYSLLASEGAATIAYNNSLRLNVASSNFIGKKAKVLIAYSNETFAVDNRDAAPEERSLDVEVEEPVVVKKTTRKKTTKTEEEE